MKLSIFSKETILFIILGGIFISNALLAEFLGVKIFSLERTLGWEEFNISLLGIDNLSFNLTIGVILWPVVFVLTDVINEYYGKKGVKFLSYLTVGLISYAFIVSYIAINLPPSDFWITSHLLGLDDSAVGKMSSEVSNYNTAYQLVFGQGMWIIIGSLVAFLIGQFVDVIVFHRIKKWTGERGVWLRATGSTLVSQFIDSFVVLFVAFYIGAGWSLEMVIAVGIVNYIYKFFVAIILTPIIYLAHYLIDTYLGEELSLSLRREAMKTK